MGFLVYLAGGMEYAKDGRTWRTTASTKLKRKDIETWDPYIEEKKLSLTKEISFLKECDKEKHFERINKFIKGLVYLDLSTVEKKADVLLVKYDKSVIRGAGTHAEISLATYKNKPVHVWLSGLTLNEVPSWAIGCFTTVSSSLEDAITKVIETYETISNQTQTKSNL